MRNVHFVLVPAEILGGECIDGDILDIEVQAPIQELVDLLLPGLVAGVDVIT
jgi:hypothetical protein